MKPIVSFSLLTLGLVGLSSAQTNQPNQPNQGVQLLFSIASNQEFTQTGAFKQNFLGGEFSATLLDGQALYDGMCGLTNMPFADTGTMMTGCTADAFIVAGDLDMDGSRDDGFFFQAVEIAPAVAVAPFQPELAEVLAAPPGSLLRNATGFTDQSASIFFDITSPDVFQYNISFYEFSRTYPAGFGSLGQMNDDIVPGAYVFGFPSLAQPGSQVSLPAGIGIMPKGFDPSDRRNRSAFRFTTGPYWDGAIVADPRTVRTISWRGNDSSTLSPGIDRQYVEVLTYDGASGIPGTMPVFPPTGTGVTTVTPFESSYSIPPFLFEVGDFATFQVRYERNATANGVAFDNSVRIFSAFLRFVDSYTGFAVTAFPAGANRFQTQGKRDFDSDGVSNIKEFGCMTDPTSAASVPADPVAIQNPDGTVSFMLTKRPDAWVKYDFRVSEDGGRFRKPKKARTGGGGGGFFGGGGGFFGGGGGFFGGGGGFFGRNRSNTTWIFEEDDTMLKITTEDPADAADFEAEIQVSERPI